MDQAEFEKDLDEITSQDFANELLEELTKDQKVALLTKMISVFEESLEEVVHEA